MATNFGTGLDVKSGWPRLFTYASGYRNLGNNLCRRLQTVRGSLPWDLDCGYDVRGLLRGTLSLADLYAAQAAIGAECEKDQRVQSASASIVYVPGAASLRITVAVETAEGPFTFVLSVDALTVALLETAVIQ